MLWRAWILCCATARQVDKYEFTKKYLYIFYGHDFSSVCCLFHMFVFGLSFDYLRNDDLNTICEDERYTTFKKTRQEAPYVF